MFMTIQGSYTEMSTIGKRYLEGVETQSQVYSKKQAREEFERFLNATELPETNHHDEDFPALR